jgi:hypothetical protein
MRAIAVAFQLIRNWKWQERAFLTIRSSTYSDPLARLLELRTLGRS